MKGVHWCPIPEFNLRYWFSSEGEFIRVSEEGEKLKRSMDVDRFGYRRVECRLNRRRVRHHIHRLVAINWVPRPEHLKHVPFDELEVDHIDGDPGNNHWSNLQWMTKQENMAKRWARHRVEPMYDSPGDIF